MQLQLRPYAPRDLSGCTTIWNQVVAEGIAFPGNQILNEGQMAEYFAAQSAVTCAATLSGEILGLYTLHPNGMGNLSHIANASYAVAESARGKGVGGRLVAACLEEAKQLGFRGIQFNAVVATNLSAIHIYQKHGFSIIGTIPGGFHKKDGTYCDMHIMFRSL